MERLKSQEGVRILEVGKELGRLVRQEHALEEEGLRGEADDVEGGTERLDLVLDLAADHVERSLEGHLVVEAVGRR